MKNPTVSAPAGPAAAPERKPPRAKPRPPSKATQAAFRAVRERARELWLTSGGTLSPKRIVETMAAEGLKPLVTPRHIAAWKTKQKWGPSPSAAIAKTVEHRERLQHLMGLLRDRGGEARVIELVYYDGLISAAVLAEKLRDGFEALKASGLGVGDLLRLMEAFPKFVKANLELRAQVLDLRFKTSMAVDGGQPPVPVDGEPVPEKAPSVPVTGEVIPPVPVESGFVPAEDAGRLMLPPSFTFPEDPELAASFKDGLRILQRIEREKIARAAVRKAKGIA